MYDWPTTSMGETSSMLKLARFFTERFIMDRAMRMKARGIGSFCSSVSSTIKSFNFEKGLSTICTNTPTSAFHVGLHSAPSVSLACKGLWLLTSNDLR